MFGWFVWNLLLTKTVVQDILIQPFATASQVKILNCCKGVRASACVCLAMRVFRRWQRVDAVCGFQGTMRALRAALGG